MKNYCIVKDGVITNVIVCAHDDIATKLGALPAADGATIGEMYVAPEPDPSPAIHAQIDELKAYLTATDYKAIKYAEGQYTEEEYAPIGAQRQAWRDQINELESILHETKSDE